jgi:hypothetical protein
VTYEILKKALSYRYTNPIIIEIIKTYKSYKRKKELLQEFGSTDLHIVSTHKLYEFWILATIIKEFINKGWKIIPIDFKIKSQSDQRSKFTIYTDKGSIELFYDSPMKSTLITSLTTDKKNKLRPDIYLKFNSINYTIDAKYKYKLETKDIKQALLFLSELSQPNLLAVIAYLGEPKKGVSGSVTIKACTAHPERGIDISCLLEPILSQF